MTHAEFFAMARAEAEEIHVWTDDEILAQPHSGKWFYGLIHDHEGQERLAEILPAYGAAMLDEPLDLTDQEIVIAIEDCWSRKPVHTGSEAELRAAATLAHHDQLQAEVETRATMECSHSTRQDLERGSWCPNCWRYFRPDEPEELPEGQYQIMMPPHFVRKLKRLGREGSDE